MIESLLSLRSGSMYPLRALRGGLPERTSERDALDPLGRPAAARAVGWRQGDWRIQLCELRTLRYGLPVQCAYGKVDDRPRGLLHRAAQADAGSG